MCKNLKCFDGVVGRDEPGKCWPGDPADLVYVEYDCPICQGDPDEPYDESLVELAEGENDK